ncbi:amino acid adenylation domain-containing protein [Kocuria carniphila]|uniref:Amino acid adenylation domain-containing protein n=1 Tax=Kocuria carniphila TaxID=262208 RepID=A0ABV3V5F3_9MICC
MINAEGTTTLPEAVRLALQNKLTGGSISAAPSDALTDRAPLTPAQERMLVEHEINPDSTAYNVVHAVRLDGHLDLDALRSACRTAFGRRPALLATVSKDEAGRPVQSIGDAPEDPLEVVTDSDVETVLRGAADHVYDLSAGPLAHVWLVAESPTSHVLIIGMHHIVTDGWSIGLFLDDLREFYGQVVNGASPADDSDNYLDAVRDMINRPKQKRAQTARNYWREALEGLRPLELPRHADATARSGRGEAIRTMIGADTRHRLGKVAAETGTTPFMVLAAATTIHLGRLAGTSDVTVLTAVGARTTREQDRTVGMFVDTVPLRIQFHEDESLRSFLSRVRATVLGAQAHTQLPFQEIVADASRSGIEAASLAAASVNLGPHADERMTWTDDLTATVVPSPVSGASTELGYHFSLAEDSGELVLVYATDQFTKSTVRSWAEDFHALLERLLRSPDSALADVDGLAPANRDKVTREFPTAGGQVESKSFFEALSAVAKTVPDVTALEGDEESLTYAETVVAADTIGRALAARGVHRGDVVATRLPRGVSRTLAFLGCARIGALYMPLDVKHPPARLDSLISQARPVLLIGDDGTSDATVTELRSHQSAPGTDPVTPSAAEPLYLIFTSGSTGEPKGVIVTNSGTCQLAEGMGSRFDVQPGDRWLQFAPIAFDASMAELLTTLLRGATAVFTDTTALMPGNDLCDTLRRRAISHVILPPTALNVMDPSEIAETVSIMVAGEPCPPSLIARWGHGRRLVNGYGPTEGTVCSSLSSSPLDDGSIRGGSVSIGAPMPQVEIRIVDDLLRPVPLGVRGEICFAGPSMAWGYLGRSGETASRFVANPWGPPGSRMYRTGDLGSWRTDGTLDCYGRIDTQVKVRGHRIELGEVERALEGHPDVEQAVATVHTDPQGHRRLIGYVVGTPDTAGVRAAVRETLPSYMVPALVMEIDRLPLTSNGKIDRGALPTPGHSRPETNDSVALTSQETAVEQTLARSWSEVLGVDEIKPEDNFFELGGDSILALQAVAVAKRSGVDIAPAQLMRAESLSELAALAAPHRTHSAQDVPKATHGPAFPAAPVQQWFFENLTESIDRFHQAKLLQIAPTSPARMREILCGLTKRHAALRTRYFRSGGSYIGVADDDAFDDSGIVVMRGDDPDLVTASLANAESGFDPGKGQLLHAVHIQGMNQHHDGLFLCVHHLAVDAVSWRTIVSELSEDLAGTGQVTRESAPRVEFADWAHAYATWAPGAAAEQADYWDRVHQAIASRNDLSAVSSESPNYVAESRNSRDTLTATETEALVEAARRLHATQEELLLAAVTAAMHRRSDADAAAFMMETHGRQPEASDLDVSQTIGWFTAQYPLLIPAGPDLNQQLERVQEALAAVPTSGLGHGAALQHASSQLTPLAVERCIGFNFLGRIGAVDANDTMTELAHRSEPRAAEEARIHLLEINAWIADEALSVEWTFPDGAKNEETIELLMADVMGELRRFGQPQRFPLTGRTDDELKGVLDRYPDAIDLYPLAPNQLGMVFHSLQADATTSDVYLGRFQARIRRVNDPQQLVEAWRHLVRRHDILRTAFTLTGGEQPLQVVLPHADLDIQITDARGHDSLETVIDDIEAARLRVGMDLERAPLLTVDLVRTGEDTWTMMWRIHHAINDGWSFTSLLDELLTLCSCAEASEMTELEQRLPERPRYRDYIQWLARQDTAEAIRHWAQPISRLSEPTPLPFGAVADRDARAAEFMDWSMPASIGTRLRARARHERVTLGTVINAAWAVLLGRYANVATVCFGTAVSGRPTDLPGAEAMIGPFMNIVPTTISTDGEGDVWTWMKALQEEQLSGQHAHHAPLPLVQRSVGWGGNLFDSIVVFENYPTSDVPHSGVQIDEVSGHEQTNYALMLSVDAGADVHLQIGFDPEIFHATEIEQLREAFDEVVTRIVNDPETPVSELIATSVMEPGLIGADAPAHSVGGLAHFVEGFAIRNPDAPAVIGRGTTWDYRELSHVVRYLVGLLSDAGIERGDLVGVHLDRDDARVVAAYTAIGALGAAFVPLDPVAPDAHFQALAADTKAILTDRAAPTNTPVIHIGAVPADIEIAPLVPTELSAHDLAYVMPTSGTSGAPKRVLVQAGNVAHMLASWKQEYDLDDLAPDVLSVSPMSTDLHFSDMLIAFSTGSALTLVPDDAVHDPAALADMAGTSGAGLLITVPALGTALSAELGRRGSESHDLRVLMVGSEGWPARDAVTSAAALPNTRVVNAYGATETTVDSTRFTVDESSAAYASRRFSFTPVGQAMPGTSVRVLDRNLRPVPVGGIGDCYIGGPGIASGYIGQAAVTASRFVPDPYASTPGRRMYRTGDRVVLTADNGLVYIGRDDDQVKFGGVRIDLASVDAALRAQPGVEEAAATVAASGPYEQRVVGYIVSHDEMPDTTAMRSALRAQLPSAAVPATIVVLDELPRTGSGTVKRRALPVPTADASRGDAPPPSTETERRLLTIWAEVMGRPSADLSEGFLLAGGDSLRAIQLVSRIAAEFSTRVSPRTVFEAVTVRDLAAAIDQEVGDGAGGLLKDAAISVANADEATDHPATAAQQRLWYLGLSRPAGTEYHITTAMRLDDSIDLTRLEHAVQLVAERHAALRTTFTDANGVLRQHVAPTAEAEIGVVAECDDADVADVMAKYAAAPFDLTASAWRVGMVITPTSRCLIAVVHHIITDGWSMQILERDVTDAYFGRLSEATPLGYADYADWAEAEDPEVLANGVKHWQDVLAGHQPLELPIAVDTHTRSAAGVIRELSVDESISVNLRHSAQELGVSDFALFAAASSVVLGRYCGTDDVLLGTPVSGRRSAELEQTVGLFVNTVPLRIHVDETAPLTSLVEHVQQQVLDGLEHGQVPFEQIVKATVEGRNAGRNALVEVMVNYERIAPVTVREESNHCVPLEVVSNDLTHDLSINVVDDGTRMRMFLATSTHAFPDEFASDFGERLLELLRDFSRTNLRGSAVRELGISEATETPRRVREEPTLLHRFSAAASSAPDESCIVTPDAQMSFAEAARASRRMAEFLHSRGIVQGDLVAVSARRTSLPLLTLLGAWRLGVGVILLPPDAPEARINEIIRQATPKIVLDDNVSLPTSEFVGTGPALDDVAYVLFTSGSTGVPKGVVVTHRQLAHFAVGLSTDVYPSTQERLPVVSTAPLTFDAAFSAITAAFLGTAELHIVDETTRQDPTEIVRYLRDQQVAMLETTPTYMNSLLDAGVENVRSLRRVVLGGETIDTHLWDRLAALPCVVFNAYGPTECTVDATSAIVAEGVDPHIGRPLRDVQLCVLDQWLREVPVDGVGELYVRGPQVAQGYLARPDLTADRFVADIHGCGERMYRTGDIVRRDRTGNLRFLRRGDDQIKLRGQRIELGEVEAALHAVLGVRQAAAVVTGAAGHDRLIGFVVPEPGTNLAEEDLMDSLRRSLPAYLVPSELCQLEAIPLTTSGKTDRQALSAWTLPERQGRGHTPETDQERAIAAVWTQLLGTTDPRGSDNFFELGGDSIRSMQLCHQLHQVGWQVHVRDVQEAPTLSALARRLKATTPSDTSGPAGDEHALSPMQQDFLDSQADPSHFRQSVDLRLAENVDADHLALALREVITLHPALRTAYVHRPSGWEATVTESERDVLLVEDLSHLETAEAQKLVQEGASGLDASCRLEEAELVHAKLWRMPDGTRTLHLTIHHLGVDAVSWGIILSDLESAYENLTGKAEGSILSATAAPGAYQHTLRETARHGDFDADGVYWHREIHPPIPRVTTRMKDLESVEAHVDGHVYERLARLLPQSRRLTLRDAVLTATARALCTVFEVNDIAVDVEAHGREQIGDGVNLARSVGWFTTVAPVFLSAPDAGGVEAVRRVRRELRKMPRNGLTYGVLRQERSTEAGIRTDPSPIMFNFHSAATAMDLTASHLFAELLPTIGEPEGTELSTEHPLELVALDDGNSLTLSWSYAPSQVAKDLVVQIIESIQAFLEELDEEVRNDDIN